LAIIDRVSRAPCASRPDSSFTDAYGPGGSTTINNVPIFVASGTAAEVIEGEGRRFIDLAGGIGVLIVGRGKGNVIDAIHPQLGRHDAIPDLVTTAQALMGSPVESGDPVVFATALTVLSDLTETELMDRGQHQGRVVWEHLRPLEDAFGIVGEVRVQGALVALELVVDERTRGPNGPAAAAVVKRCHDNGVLVLKAGTDDNVLRLMAPPVISDDDLHEGLEILTDALEWANKGMPAA
jgi:4-aminobutyrate aminotransferase-like enzyme